MIYSVGLNCNIGLCYLQEAVQHAFGMIEVTQPHEHLQADVAVGAANDVPDQQPYIDISPGITGGQYAMRPLIPANDDRDSHSFDVAAFGSDGFRPYSSPSRVRMLNFRVEYRQNNVPIVLQDINCVGECALVCRVYACS